MVSHAPIVIAGSIAIDRIMRFNGTYADYIHPEAIDTLSVSIFLEAQTDTYGGVGANIAYSLALLGAQPILVGSVGPDARPYITRLRETGVITDHIYESTLPTAAFNVITDGKHNQLGGFYPGAMFDSDSLTLSHWQGSDALIVLSPHDPKAMQRHIEEAQAHELRLLYDIGQQVSNTPAPSIQQGVDAATILIVNDYEMAVLCDKLGTTAAALQAKLPIVITTHGENGSTIAGKEVGNPIDIPAVKVPEAIDPTGAGDAFRSGFLYGYTRGWNLSDAAELGATCAAFAVESAGTQAHAFTLDQVTERHAKAYGRRLPIG